MATAANYDIMNMSYTGSIYSTLFPPREFPVKWTIPSATSATTDSNYLYPTIDDYNTCINSSSYTVKFADVPLVADYVPLIDPADTEAYYYSQHTLPTNYTISFGNEYTIECTPVNPKKLKLQDNLRVSVKTRADYSNNVADNEKAALGTLREYVTELEFRKYLKYGFVLVKGMSGNVYQVYKNKAHTRVWKNGKVIEEICVRLKGFEAPPTDNVIAFKTMIEADESEFKKLGNVYNMQYAA